METREGNDTPLQYSCLENPMNGGAWWAAVHGVTKSQTPLRDFTFTFHFHALEKEMATHSSVLAWRIPGTGEPGGLLSMGSHRVGHNWSDLAAAVAAGMETRLIKAEEWTERAFGLPQVEVYTSLKGSCKDRRVYLAQRQVEAHSVLEEKRVLQEWWRRE